MDCFTNPGDYFTCIWENPKICWKRKVPSKKTWDDSTTFLSFIFRTAQSHSFPFSWYQQVVRLSLCHHPVTSRDATWRFIKFTPKPVRSGWKPLVPSVALLLTRNCCPVLIKVTTLQHPHCGHKLAAASFYVTDKHRLCSHLFILKQCWLVRLSYFDQLKKKNSDWSFLRLNCEISDLESKRSNCLTKLLLCCIHHQSSLDVGCESSISLTVCLDWTDLRHHWGLFLSKVMQRNVREGSKTQSNMFWWKPFLFSFWHKVKPWTHIQGFINPARAALYPGHECRPAGCH